MLLLEKVLSICAEKGLELSPPKFSFNPKEVLWYDRVMAGENVRHDSARITALSSLPASTTRQELQQFVCALNWMRVSLTAFNNRIDSLVKVMDRVYEQENPSTIPEAVRSRVGR